MHDPILHAYAYATSQPTPLKFPANNPSNNSPRCGDMLGFYPQCLHFAADCGLVGGRGEGVESVRTTYTYPPTFLTRLQDSLLYIAGKSVESFPRMGDLWGCDCGMDGLG